MAAAKHHDTGFDKWKRTIDQALTDSAWDEYDCDIMHSAIEFNQHLAGTPGFIPLDWRIVKAMIWTETSGPSKAAWKSAPMQIGDKRDPGLRALFAGREGGELIIPPSLKPRLTAASAIATPLMNIKAGIAYLLMRFAVFGYRTVTEGRISDYTVHRRDTLDRIARGHHSTVETLRHLNPGVRTLHPSEIIKLQEAKMEKVIVRWHLITTVMIAHRYNVGDIRYAEKLQYCLSVMGKVKRTAKC